MSGQHLAEGAARAVRAVGGLLRHWRDDATATSGSWDGQQFKAEADGMAHEALSSRLRAVEPHTPVISEEDPDSLAGERPSRYWLIDPIDGTASFAHGYPGFVTQAALMIGARPRIAAVYAPALDLLYTARAGHGAWLNGRPLAAPPCATGARRTLIDNTPQPQGIALAAYGHFGCTGYLESGSLSLKLCRLADGTADLFLKDVPVRDWDVAAPHLVLAEAGAAACRLDGAEFSYLGEFEHVGLIGAADPRLCRAVAQWHGDVIRK